MEKDILGVIGGLGPLATAHFMELVTRMTDAKKEQQNVDMIVYNFPSIPDRTGYLLGSNLRSPLPGLLWAGRALARQEVSCIAVPCINAHYFYQELAEDLPIPILNALTLTVQELKKSGVRSAGIMASEGTIVSGIFSGALLDAGIRPVLPSREVQEDVTHLIYRNIKAGHAPEMDRFYNAEDQLRRQGAEVIILGCTELSLIKKQQPLKHGFLDALEVLARQSVLSCHKPLKRAYTQLIN